MELCYEFDIIIKGETSGTLGDDKRVEDTLSYEGNR